MGRLLDEDDVVDWLLKRTEMYDATGHFVDENVVKKNIESQIAKIPTSHPEIIRCKDCKHRPFKRYDGIVPPKEDDWKCPCLCDDYFYSWIPGDNFFCANGERREE